MMPGGPWHLSKNATELQWPWVRSPCGLNTMDLPLFVGLAAKPVIDIQVSVATLRPLDRYITPLAVLGYVHVPHEDDAVCPYFPKPKTWPHTQSRASRNGCAETTNSRRLHFGISFVITRR